MKITDNCVEMDIPGCLIRFENG